MKAVSAFVRPCFGLEAQCATVIPKSASWVWKPVRWETGGKKQGESEGRSIGLNWW